MWLRRRARASAFVDNPKTESNEMRVNLNTQSIVAFYRSVSHLTSIQVNCVIPITPWVAIEAIIWWILSDWRKPTTTFSPSKNIITTFLYTTAWCNAYNLIHLSIQERAQPPELQVHPRSQEAAPSGDAVADCIHGVSEQDHAREAMSPIPGWLRPARTVSWRALPSISCSILTRWW